MTKHTTPNLFKPGMNLNGWILLEQIEHDDVHDIWKAKKNNEEKLIEIKHPQEQMATSHFTEEGREVVISSLKASQLRVGDYIGQWQCVRRLSRGSFSENWLVKSVALPRAVLKLFTTDNSEAETEFEYELYVTRRLQGEPGIVHLRDYAKSGEQYWMVTTPFLTTFSDYIASTTSPVALFAMMLGYLYLIDGYKNKGLLYRDVKLEHLSCTSNQLFIIDYGSILQSEKQDKTGMYSNENFEAHVSCALVKSLFYLADKYHIEFDQSQFNFFLDSKGDFDLLDPLLTDQLIQSLTTCTKDDVNLLLIQFYFALSAKCFNVAELLIKALHSFVANTPEFSYLSALLHFNNKEYSLAAPAIAAAIKLNSTNATFYYLQGEIADMNQTFFKARNAYKKALLIDPKLERAYANLIMSKMRIKEAAQFRLSKRHERKCNQGKCCNGMTVRAKQDLFLPLMNIDIKKTKSFNQAYLLRNENLQETDKGVAWEQYFLDLSDLSFKFVFDETRRPYRERAWHFAFKYANCVADIIAHSGHGATILDLGCSTGYLRRALQGNLTDAQSAGFHYYGVDIRYDVLHRATFNTNDIESGANSNIPAVFLQADLTQELPVKACSMDSIVSFEAIKYLSVTDATRLLTRIKSWLKKSGHFYFSTTCSNKSSELFEGLLLSEVEAVLQECGFKVDACFGSQASLEKMLAVATVEQKKQILSLLTYHPKEMVAAIMAPFFPDVALQVYFKCE